MRICNVIGPEVRRLRSRRNWSQNDLTIKLQLLGMEDATRARIAKIESRLIRVSDDDMIYLARAFRVSIEELYPDHIRDAKTLYHAIALSKASRFGVFILALTSCSQMGATLFDLGLTLPPL